MVEEEATDGIKPIREGLVTGCAGGARDVGLLGSKCDSCGEVSIGTNPVCLNCGGNQIRKIALSSEGELWTYTIVRHKPPGEYLGPEPFVPYALGLVELPEGVRIMAPLEGDVDAFTIGTRLELMPWILRAADGQTYRAFRFAPIGA